MKQYLITFAVDYPDDAVWNALGDLEVPGGHQLAQWIASSLSNCGARCSEVCQRSYFGWEFEIALNSVSAIAVLQQTEDWLLVLAPNVSLFGWLRAKLFAEIELRTIAETVTVILKANEKVSNIRLMTGNEYRDDLQRQSVSKTSSQNLDPEEMR